MTACRGWRGRARLNWSVWALACFAGCALPAAPASRRLRDVATEVVADATTDAVDDVFPVDADVAVDTVNVDVSDAGAMDEQVDDATVDASDATVADVDALDAREASDAADVTDVADARDAADVDVAVDAYEAAVDGADASDAASDAGPTCTATELLCDGACINPLASNAHCGRCGNACSAPETCLSGSCSCPGGARVCDGLCVDLAINPNHCGRCGNACVGAQSCVDGACACTGGRSLCGTQCVALATDANNCGRCGIVCGPGINCRAGACECAPGWTWCDGRCVYLPNDRTNCGACGNACGTSSSCVSGACQTMLTCAGGLADCNGFLGDLCETDILTSVEHCGRCGHPCAPGERCEAGACLPPRHCRDIRSNWPSLPSGTYTIRPDASTVSVWCDMDTANGGWTVIYQYPGQRRPPMMIDYTVNNLAIPAAAMEALIAYRDGSYRVTDPSWAYFPIPVAWQTASPFRARNSDVSVRVTQATGVPEMRTLRFGYSEYGNDCHSNWDTLHTGGRICIDGTTAPFFCEFVSTTFNDRCPNSNQRYDAATCTTGRRFSIAVR